MKRVRRILALVLCAALLLSMAGCAQKPAETTAPPTTQAPTTVPTEPPAEDIYAAARVALDHASHLTMEVVITTVTEVAGDAFSQKSVQTLTYKDLDTEEGVIVCEEDLTFSVHDDELDPDTSDPTAFREIWYQGNLYVEMDSTYRYRGPLEKDAAVSRYVPAVLLNAELYGTLTAETTAEGTCLTFGEASAAENWALPEEGELLEAGGTALVSADGVLTEMTYTVVYQNGPARVTKTVAAKPQATPRTVTAPANPDTYTDLTYVDALRLNVQIPYLLVQTDSAAVVSIESLFSQAAGFLRNQNTTTNLQGRDSDTKAKIETGVYVMDYSSMQDQKYDLEETYINGQLTTVENDGLPSTSSGITWEDMRLYVTEQILAELVDWSYWDDATMTDLGSVMYLEYDLTENFGNTIQNSICQMLWDDPSFLIALADDYRNEEINGYLSVDKYTGLPVATGYYYKGVHTIEGQDYALTLQYDQTFESPAKGAYQEITDEMPAEAEPENKATPLFYHVTGENGQEMWLLGTIHVGDERTGFLPEEIYNAFAASDALALECDSEAFDEQVEEDDALSEEVSGLYFYSDGTTIESLMEEEEYARALQLLKATGCYNMNMPYAKPYLWSSSIDQFYLRQGYQLHGDQGVEERLCDWAEELDKEIREVESSLFQIRMLTGFSNDLQLQMLRETMETSARDSWESTWELYELWCAGDEAALRAELSDAVDMTDWTEEEIAEYESQKHLIEEYNKAMSYDRNDGMLKKAIEYLESGDVVFYAVGLAHLLNDVNGLVDALRAAGYTVEPVTYG
jgi:uncharacterized protein YbaP (TraB family)